MSEGGMYPWKVQKITYPKNGIPGNYTNLSHPLPDPPKDQIWVQDIHTREWKLVPLVVAAVASHDTEEDEVVEGDSAAAAAAEHPVVLASTTITATTVATADDTTTNNHATSTNGSITTAIPISTFEIGIPIDNIIRNTTTTSSNNNSSLQIINGIQYHTVQPTDTFQGLCLRYKLTPMELRRANNMVLMDSNLTLHTRLIIPMSTMKPSSSNSTNTVKKGDGGVDQEKEDKITALLSKASSSRSRSNGITHNKLSYSEARAYLEIEDWDVNRAMESVGEDFGW
ncbi:hypothetical protein ACHAXH_000739 [Discostella pseudostelligera]